MGIPHLAFHQLRDDRAPNQSMSGVLFVGGPLTMTLNYEWIAVVFPIWEINRFQGPTLRSPASSLRLITLPSWLWSSLLWDWQHLSAPHYVWNFTEALGTFNPIEHVQWKRELPSTNWPPDKLLFPQRDSIVLYGTP